MIDIKTLNARAIITGFMVDIIGTLIAGTVIGIIAILVMTSGGTSAEQVASELTASSAFQNLSLFIGFSCTFLGGYTAAKLAGKGELTNAFGAGVLSTLFSLIVTLFTETTGLSDYAIILFVIPFAVLGGYLKKITAKQSNPQ